jgi:hypothetical protein
MLYGSRGTLILSDIMFRIDLLYYFFSNLRKHNIRLYKIKYEVKHEDKWILRATFAK